MKKLIIISLVLISLSLKSFAHGGDFFLSLEYGKNLTKNNYSLQYKNPYIVYGLLMNECFTFGIGSGLNYSNWKSKKNLDIEFENYQIPLFIRTSFGLPLDFFVFIPYSYDFSDSFFLYIGFDFGANISLSTNTKGNYSNYEYKYNRSGVLLNPAIGLRYDFSEKFGGSAYGAFNIFAQIGMNNNLMFGKRGSAPHSISSLELKAGISLPIEDWYLSLKKPKQTR